MKPHRRPIAIETQLREKVLTGYAGVWAAIRKLEPQGWFFVDQVLDEMVGNSKGTADDYISRLVKAGYLEKGEKRLYKSRWRHVYRVVRSVKTAPALRRDGSIADEKGRGQRCMWTAMVNLEKFTVAELIKVASIPKKIAEEHRTKPLTISRCTALTYIRHLECAGYLRLLDAQTDRYRLLPSKKTGPKAPMLQRATFVFDPNLGEIVGRAATIREIFP